jgi:hypothetical protein
MRFISRLFNDVEGIYWFPIIALVLFVALFIAIAVHTWFIKKDRAEKLSKLPLDDDEEDTDLDQKQV